MSYKNKTYICFDADNDISYYNLMKAWKENDQIAFNFHNAHELNNLRNGSNEETVKAKLRERLNNTKILIVLIGENTKNLYKYVRWEIEFAIEEDIPIIAVNLNGMKKCDETLCPPILKNELVLHISYGQKIMNIALNDWPKNHYENLKNSKRCAYNYKKTVYEK